mgnify:CR=1 FL=1
MSIVETFPEQTKALARLYAVREQFETKEAALQSSEYRAAAWAVVEQHEPLIGFALSETHLRLVRKNWNDSAMELRLVMFSMCWSYERGRGSKFSSYFLSWGIKTLARVESEYLKADQPYHLPSGANRAWVEKSLDRIKNQNVNSKERKFNARSSSLDSLIKQMTPVLSAIYAMGAERVVAVPPQQDEDGFTDGESTDPLASVQDNPMFATPFDNPVQENLLATAQMEAMAKMFSQLPCRMQKVLDMRYGLAIYQKEHTFKEIGNAIGVTQERARQIVRKAQNILRWKCWEW